ncbi:methylenetetrahydrofolate reductase [Spirochaetia bacterium]|nr:methylenetetrahydrofolate reductase [Spirochaetia bacterium]
MIVSLELVPRNQEALAGGAQAIKEFAAISRINVPDLLRFPIRSWEACEMLNQENAPGKNPPSLIPHLRAIDFDPDRPFPHKDFFRAQGIKEALVISGDPPAENDTRKIWPIDSLGFIKKLKAEMPELQIFAAFDPYRSNIRYELDYLDKKEAAGAAGFMSQPFFDLRLLEIYAEYLEGKNVYWGVSPALTDSNRRYWESRNRAVFPKSFRPGMEWNINFGRSVLRFCEDRGFNLYLMPIKIDIRSYLSGLFNPGP